MKTLLAILLLIPSLSWGMDIFNIKGIDSNMNIDEVSKVAKKANWDVIINDNEVELKDGYKTKLMITYCSKNKEIIYHAYYTGDIKRFHNFPKVIITYQKAGYEIVDAISETFMNDDTEYTLLKIEMNNGSYDYGLTTTLYSIDDIGVTNYQTSIYYYDKSKRCN